jgi:hypothetical protein
LLGRCSSDTVLVGDLSVAHGEADVELARLTLQAGTLIVSSAKSLLVEDCIFKGNGDTWASSLVSFANAKGDGDFAILRSSFSDGGTGISGSGGLRHGIVQNCRFENLGGDSVSFTSLQTMLVADNWFIPPASGTTKAAMSVLLFDGLDVEVTVVGNWIDAGYRSGIGLLSIPGTVSVLDNSFQAADLSSISLHSLGGGGDPRGAASAELMDNRFQGSGESNDANGIYVGESSNVDISGSIISGMGAEGIDLLGSQAIRVSGGYIANCKGPAISVQANSAEDGTEIDGLTAVGNEQGVYARAGGAVAVSGSLLAANVKQGIALQGIDRADITDNTVVSNGSTGIDLTALSGEGVSAHMVSNNTSLDNRGLGILVRAGGPARVILEDNLVQGTRAGNVSNAEYPSFKVGDGLAVLTGANGVPSQAELRGTNEVGGNARLGILAHGTGTAVAVVDEPEFAAGNGYGGFLGDPPTGGSWDLVQANGAEVVGAIATIPDQDIPAPDSVALGGGGDPR